MLFLKIVGGLAALGLGVWLGMPGKFEQTPEQIEDSLGVRRASRKATRHFTPLDWIRPKQRPSDKRRNQGTRRPFELDG